MSSRIAEMISAMCAYLIRLGQLAFIQRVVAFRTFNENAFRLNGSFFVVLDVVDLGFIAAKP